MELIDKDTALGNYHKYNRKLGVSSGFFTSNNDGNEYAWVVSGHSTLGSFARTYQKSRFYPAVCVIK